MHDKDYAAKLLLLLMIFCLLIVVCGVFLQGCEFDSVCGNVVISNDKLSYTVESFDPFMNMGNDFEYIVDKNTNVVYIRTYSQGRTGITAAYNSDGSVMKLEDLPKLMEDK